MALSEQLADLRSQLAAATDPDEIMTLRLRLGVVCRQAGSGLYLSAGDVAAAREAFTQSAHNYREFIAQKQVHSRLDAADDGWENVAIIAQDAVAMAMLSADETQRRETATELLALPEAYVDTFGESAYIFYYVMTYACAMTEHLIPDARIYLEETFDAIESHPETTSVDEPGLWMALNGILTDDCDMIVEGLEANVDARTAAAETEEPSLFVRGLGMTNLARLHGYDVDPSTSAIPDDLLIPSDGKDK